MYPPHSFKMSSKIHVLSAAPVTPNRPGAIVQGSWAEVDRRATVRDGEIIPLEGAVGVCWSTRLHGITSTDEEIKAAIRQKAVENNVPRTEKQITRETKELRLVCATLKKGDKIALKQGTKIRAIVELTSDYQFCPEENWGWHTWTYKRVQVVTEAQWPTNYRGLLKTFHPNFLSWPL